MPGALSEVGSINLREEHDLLASPEGQDAVAAGLFDGLSGFFASRDLAARIAPEGETPGTPPDPIAGDGPPYWAERAPDGPLRLRLTNTGTEAWPAGTALVAGWEGTELPYLAVAPDLEPLAVEVPDLGPGESVVVEVSLPPVPSGRAVAWITLRAGDVALSDGGSPPLQLSTEAD
jgi:hypothetical protein